MTKESFVELVESIQDGFSSLDRDWRFTYINHRAAENVGLFASDIVGRNIWELFPSLLGTEQERIYRRVMDERVSASVEVKGTLSDRWYRLSVCPVTDGISIFWTDISERKRAEEALRESEARLRGILDATQESVWLFSSEGETLQANETALRRLGRPRDEVIGKNFRELLPPELARARQARLDHVVASGRPLEFEDERNGINFRHSFYPVTDGEGRVTRVAVFSRDITDRARAEAALRVLIENMTAGVALIDETGKFSLYNRQFLKLFGLAPDSDIENVNSQDWSAWQVVDEEGRPLHADEHPVRKAALGRRAVRDQLVGVRVPQGQHITWMLVSAEPLFDANGRMENVICTYSDITAQKRAEEALREVDRRKNAFLGVLSHELRNPLAPITNSLYILDHAAPGGEQASRAKQVIARQVAQLSNLVNDLLDVTRISRDKIRLNKERLELNELARRAVEDNRFLFENVGVQLELETASRPVHVLADRTRVVQVIGNLLQNAAKFTRKGGRARVTLAVEGTEAVLRIVDDGVGMTPEALARLFQPFMQVDQTLDRSKGGLGIGLALVKGLVELHGGRIAAKSEGIGKGTEFVVRLPLDAGAAFDMASSVHGRERARRRVLIIEDNHDAADSLREVLELGENEVEVAHNGPDGVTKACAFKPDLVLCDIGLPGMDGYEVARVLRADDVLRHTCLVALSGYTLAEDLQRAAEAGFDRHLPKPPALDRLEELLETIPRSPQAGQLASGAH